MSKLASYLGSGHGPFAPRVKRFKQRHGGASNQLCLPVPMADGRDRCSVSPVFPVSTISGSKASVASATKSFTSSIWLHYAQPAVSVCKQAREGTTVANWQSTAKGRADTAKEGRQHVGNRACKQLKQYRQLLLVAHDQVVAQHGVVNAGKALRVNSMPGLQPA